MYKYPLYGSGASLNDNYAAQRALTELLQLILLYDEEDINLHNILYNKWKDLDIVNETLNFKFLSKLELNKNPFCDDKYLELNNLNDILFKELDCLLINGITVYQRIIKENNQFSMVQMLIPGFERFNLILEGATILPNGSYKLN